MGVNPKDIEKSLNRIAITCPNRNKVPISAVSANQSFTGNTNVNIHEVERKMVTMFAAYRQISRNPRPYPSILWSTSNEDEPFRYVVWEIIPLFRHTRLIARRCVIKKSF